MINWEKLKEDPAYECSRLCQINTANLVDALEKHAALYAYVNALYEKARATETRREWQYEQEKAQVFAQLRAEGTAIGEASETAELNEQVKEARKAYMKAEEKRRLLWALVDSLDTRKDMLIQLSARQRAEMD